MHIESAQGNYTHSWINFFSSIQKGKNSILVKLLHLHIKYYSIAVNSLCTQMLSCFWNWKFWDFMNCHYPFISGEGTSYNNTAMIWIPINTFGPLRKGDVSMVKVTYVTPQVTQLLVDINNIRLSFLQQIYIIDQVWGQDDCILITFFYAIFGTVQSWGI